MYLFIFQDCNGDGRIDCDDYFLLHSSLDRNNCTYGAHTYQQNSLHACMIRADFGIVRSNLTIYYLKNI